jgi:hypothetical protein
MRLEAFKSPGILRGLSPEESAMDYMAGWQWVHAEHFTPNPYFHSIRSRMPFEPVTFARLIAKIAHCITVRAEGIDGFEPFLTDIIRGKDLSKLWYFIGGLDTRPTPYGRPLSTSLWVGEPGRKDDFIFAEIRLFADLGAPIYYAIVGQNPKRGGGLKRVSPAGGE